MECDFDGEASAVHPRGCVVCQGALASPEIGSHLCPPAAVGHGDGASSALLSRAAGSFLGGLALSCEVVHSICGWRLFPVTWLPGCSCDLLFARGLAAGVVWVFHPGLGVLAGQLRVSPVEVVLNPLVVESPELVWLPHALMAGGLQGSRVRLVLWEGERSAFPLGVCGGLVVMVAGSLIAF